MIDRQKLIEQYKAGFDRLREAMEGYSPEMRSFRPAPGKWTIHEIALHLLDSEAMAYTRLRKMVAENGAETQGWNQDAWVNELRYEDYPLDDALQTIGLLRKLNIRVVEEAPDLVWSTHALVHHRSGSVTLEDLVQDYVQHLDKHLGQMARNVAAFKR